MSLKVEAIVDTDVLVIGGGGAACRAAVAAHDAGARVILALKGGLGHSGATVAPGAAVAWQAGDECAGPDDSPDVHLRNILDTGLGMADPRLARILAYEIVDRMEEMEGWGLRFVPDPAGKKRHFSVYSCFGDQPRAHTVVKSGQGHAGDVVRVLEKQVAKRGVPVYENTFVTDLLVRDGRCRGALALGSDGQVVAYRAGAVILGTGGARQLYPPSGRATIDTTGDGYAMALRAGAQLTNMEFAHFMLQLMGPGMVKVQGSPWALYPILKNRLGESFLEAYLPAGVTREQAMWKRTLHAPFSCRDASGWLDVSITTEVREGRGTDDDAVWVDFSQVDLSRFVRSRPMHRPETYSGDPKLPNELMQARDTAHAINGGVRIDEQAATSLPGLYAAGETAAGPHGADRLGGGMVTNCQVFGARAGLYAARFASGARQDELPSATWEEPVAKLQRFGRGERTAQEVLVALQQETGRNLMVVRNREGLETLLDRIDELRQEWLPEIAVPEAAALERAIEVENSLLTAELMARAALMRQESRGSHFREDYPQRDDAQWGRNIVFRRVNEELQQKTGGPQLG